MRKIILLGLSAFFVTAFSGQVMAGKITFCEEAKDDLKSKQLYGLCNAYWKAGNDNARAKILANFEKKAGPSGPGMPGLELEEPDPTCPCWDYDALVQTIACDEIPYSFSITDESGDGSGSDVVVYGGGTIQLFAGHTPFDFSGGQLECDVVNAVGGDFVLFPFVPTLDAEDNECRQDIKDLIANPPTIEECQP